MDKEYIVTLKSKDDLEDFYAEMSSNGFKIAKKRPISRNTHYHMFKQDHLLQEGYLLIL